MKIALTQKQLDVAGCGTTNCGHDHTVLYFVGACHPSSGSKVNYNKSTGSLTIACERCSKLIAEVKVAAE